MTGLDLEPFLRLLRADLGVWLEPRRPSLAVLALMAWTSWGSRRALRKCLVLSIAAHVGLLLYGNGRPDSPARCEGPTTRTRTASTSSNPRRRGRTAARRRSRTGRRRQGMGRSIARLGTGRRTSGARCPAPRVAKPEPKATPRPRETPDRLAAPEANPPELAAARPPRPDDTRRRNGRCEGRRGPRAIAEGERPDVSPPPEAVARDPGIASPIRVQAESAGRRDAGSRESGGSIARSTPGPRLPLRCRPRPAGDGAGRLARPPDRPAGSGRRRPLLRRGRDPRARRRRTSVGVVGDLRSGGPRGEARDDPEPHATGDGAGDDRPGGTGRSAARTRCRPRSAVR